MNIEKILEDAREIIEKDYEIREELLPLARETIRKSSLAIRSIHAKNLEKADEKISEALEAIRKAEKIISESEFLLASNILDTPYQELTEAINLRNILKKRELITNQELKFPLRPYLLGLADLVGELRRYILDSMREGDFTDCDELLNIMEIIYEELNSLDYPNALIPNLRRKCDVCRGVIEKTRGELANAIHREKLSKQMQELLHIIEKGKNNTNENAR